MALSLLLLLTLLLLLQRRRWRPPGHWHQRQLPLRVLQEMPLRNLACYCSWVGAYLLRPQLIQQHLWLLRRPLGRFLGCAAHGQLACMPLQGVNPSLHMHLPSW
jgi:hypothetical protein